jgi:hypothetical protein
MKSPGDCHLEKKPSTFMKNSSQRANNRSIHSMTKGRRNYSLTGKNTQRERERERERDRTDLYKLGPPNKHVELCSLLFQISVPLPCPS